MTEQYPDWVYDEMAKRINDAGRHSYTAKHCRQIVHQGWQSDVALAKLIHETQEAPEDPYLPIARKVAAERLREEGAPKTADRIEKGNSDDHPYVQTALTAIHALLEHQEPKP